MRNITEAIGAKPSQAALAWLLGKGRFIVPIPGAKRRVYLEENAPGRGHQLWAYTFTMSQAPRLLLSRVPLSSSKSKVSVLPAPRSGD